jgi:hypothetical protein
MLGFILEVLGRGVRAYSGGWTYSGGRNEDHGEGKERGQKVTLRFRCYRTFRGKRCFFFYFCEI